jgi:hypothetical protein
MALPAVSQPLPLGAAPAHAMGHAVHAKPPHLGIERPLSDLGSPMSVDQRGVSVEDDGLAAMAVDGLRSPAAVVAPVGMEEHPKPSPKKAFFCARCQRGFATEFNMRRVSQACRVDQLTRSTRACRSHAARL